MRQYVSGYESHSVPNGHLAYSSGRSTYPQGSIPAATENILLKSLPRDVYRAMAPSLRPVTLRKEQFIYQEEDKLDLIYFPGTAVISDFKMLDDGRMVEIAVTGNEGAIGLTQLLSGSHHVANSVQVSQAGTAYKIDAEVFNKLIRSDDRLRTSLSLAVDRYIKQISQKAICNMFHSVRERFCTWLLMLQDRCGKKVLSLTHEQIARALGVYRPSVTCIAQEMRDDKLIDYRRGGIVLKDRSLIEGSACTCYFELGMPSAQVH